MVMQATSAGSKDQEAENFLRRSSRTTLPFTFDEAVQTAISALQSVLSEDFKASEIEVRLLYLFRQLLYFDFSSVHPACVSQVLSVTCVTIMASSALLRIGAYMHPIAQCTGVLCQ